MARSQHYAALCRRCQRPRRPDERFSYRGKCSDCSIAALVERMETASEQMDDPDYVERWAQGIARRVKLIYEERKVG